MAEDISNLAATVGPGQMARPRKPPLRAIVHSIERLTYDIRRFRFRMIEPPTIAYRPGQIIRIMVPPYGNNPQPVGRPYSIASIPGDNPFLDIMVRLVPGGICTTWLFTMLQEGDEVTLTGPYGKFGLTSGDGPVVWIGGGAGMGPFWSFLRHMMREGIRREVTYYFGAGGRDDLVLFDELTAIAGAHDWFHFVPALSGTAVDDSWPGDRGLITDILDRRLVGGDGTEFYLCGPPAMVDRVIEVLHGKNVGDESIFVDRFTGA